MKMSTNVLLLQKKEKKILLVNNKTLALYKRFLSKKQLSVRNINSFSKPSSFNFLWVFFDVRDEHFKFSTNLLPFDYFQSSLINSNFYDAVVPYLAVTSFRSETMNQASSLLFSSRGMENTFIILDKQEQFLRNEISVNVKRKRRMLSIIAKDAKRKHYASLVKRVFCFKDPIFKYLRRSIKTKRLAILRNFFETYVSPYAPKHKKIFVSRNALSDFVKPKHLSFTESKRLSFNFYVSELIKNIPRLNKLKKIRFPYVFKISDNVLFNSKPFYSYTALNLYHSHTSSQLKLKVLANLKKLQKLNIKLNDILEFFFKTLVFSRSKFKNNEISHSRLFLTSRAHLRVSKLIRKFLLTLKNYGVVFGFYLDFYIAVVRRSNLLLKDFCFSLFTTENSFSTVYRKTSKFGKSTKRLGSFKRQIKRQMEWFNRKYRPLHQKLYGLQYTDLGNQKVIVPSVFLGEENVKNIYPLYSKSRMGGGDYTMKIFYDPKLPMKTKMKLIHKRLKRLPWEEAFPRVNRWRLFNFLSDSRFNNVSRQLLSFYVSIVKLKGKGNVLIKKHHLLKFYAKRKYAHSVLFFSYLGLNKSLSINKTLPLNLHKVFLNSLQDYFAPLTKSHVFPGYFSERFSFVKKLQFIKPVRIVFSAYKEKRRSLQVHILDSNNANLFTSWPGLVIKRISSVVGYHQSHKYTFLRFMKAKQAKRNFMAKILTMRHATNFLYKYFKRSGGVFEVVIRTNFKLFGHRSNSRLLENLINTGRDSYVPYIMKKIKAKEAERRKNLDKPRRSRRINLNKKDKKAKGNGFYTKSFDSLADYSSNSNTSTKYFRYLRAFFHYLVFLRKFTIFLLFFLIKRPVFFTLIRNAFYRLIYFQSVFKFFVKSQFISFFSQRLLRSSNTSSGRETSFLFKKSFKRFSFFKRRIRMGFFGTNKLMYMSKISMHRAVRHGHALKHKKARRL